MDNITKINACITMLERIKRLSDDVDVDKYSKTIDDILNQVDDLDTDVLYDYMTITATSSSAIDTEQF